MPRSVLSSNRDRQTVALPRDGKNRTWRRCGRNEMVVNKCCWTNEALSSELARIRCASGPGQFAWQQKPNFTQLILDASFKVGETELRKGDFEEKSINLLTIIFRVPLQSLHIDLYTHFAGRTVHYVKRKRHIKAIVQLIRTCKGSRRGRAQRRYIGKLLGLLLLW